jgi:FKBP-type peptidyl-prolyl cis-trans isomerase FklB
MPMFRRKRILTTKALSAAAIIAAGVIFPGAAGAQQTQTPVQAKPATPATQTAPTAKTTKPPAATSATTTPKPAAKPTAPVLATAKQKVSYALGMDIGRDLAKQQVDLDVTTLLRGLRDAIQGNPSQLTDEQIKAALTELQNQASEAMGEANLKKGEEFLTENKAKDGVVTLPSGLQYKVVTTGTGPKPTAADTVVCDYRGTFIDGTEFDSSYKRGQTASFGVTQVIQGWTEALQLMPVGSKWQLFIPANLAYGPGGRPGIPPNSTLIFDIELHSIAGK